MNKLLGVCIPTYNRANMLHECLESFVSWAKKHNFPIFVVDDCSTDHTVEVIHNAQNEYNGISYFRNDKNLGLYLNILKAVSIPDTKYVWLMGDDDRVIAKNLHRILEYIEQDFDYIVLNSVAYDATMEHIKSQKLIECDQNSVYSPGFHEKLLKDLSVWAYHGFMSAMIARREIFLKDESQYQLKTFPYYKNNWIPLIMFYRGIVGKRGIFMCEPTIENRGDNRILKKTFWEMSVVGRIKALESLGNCGYSVRALRNAVGLNTKQILYYAANSKKANDELILCSRYIRRSKIVGLRFKVITYLLDYIPQKLFIFSINSLSNMKKWFMK